jgi:small subunit ribosomal protein S8
MKDKFEFIKIALKYDPVTKLPAIKELKRASRPGLRKYADVELTKSINGLGIAIISTSKGLMTDKESRKENIGGEVICFVS